VPRKKEEQVQINQKTNLARRVGPKKAKCCGKRSFVKTAVFLKESKGGAGLKVGLTTTSERAGCPQKTHGQGVNALKKKPEGD